MLILAGAIVALLVWLGLRRKQPTDSVALRVGAVCLIAVIAAALAVRGGPVATALILVTGGALLMWWRLRRRGGDDPGDDGPDPPDPPDPDPGPGARADVLDVEAFDRARADWERELPRREP